MSQLLEEIKSLLEVLPTDAVMQSLIAVATVVVIQEQKAAQGLVSAGAA